MAKKLIDHFAPPAVEDQPYSSEDLLRCGWNRAGRRCKLPGSVKPQGNSHYLCRWHSTVLLFSDPSFANDEKAFNEWIEAKRKQWIPVSTADVWLRPNEEIFRLAQGL